MKLMVEELFCMLVCQYTGCYLGYEVSSYYSSPPLHNYIIPIGIISLPVVSVFCLLCLVFIECRVLLVPRTYGLGSCLERRHFGVIEIRRCLILYVYVYL